MSNSLIMPRIQIVKWFCYSAAFILIVTALAKLISVFRGPKLMQVADPLFGVSFGLLLCAVGVLEIGVAAVCILVKRKVWALIFVAWLATAFIAYRIGLQWLDWHRPCGCLGTFTEALHISPQNADKIMKGVLGYLLIGSYGFVVLHWKGGKYSGKVILEPKH